MPTNVREKKGLLVPSNVGLNQVAGINQNPLLASYNPYLLAQLQQQQLQQQQLQQQQLQQQLQQQQPVKLGGDLGQNLPQSYRSNVAAHNQGRSR